MGYKPDEEDFTGTVFNPSQSKSVDYHTMLKENLSFGVALVHLLTAIDWIRLGRMPWEGLLGDVLNDEA